MACKKTFLVCLLLLSALFGNKSGAEPVIGPAVEQNGLRFESWLASPQINIPVRGTDYNHGTLATRFSIRVTNSTVSTVRFDPYALDFRLFKSNGQEVVDDPIYIASYIRSPVEADYLLLQPGQTVVLPTVSQLYWYNGRLCLSWSSKAFPDHPAVFSGLAAAAYFVHLSVKKDTPTVQIRKDFVGKIVKTLNGFWTGNVTTPPVKFELTGPARRTPNKT